MGVASSSGDLIIYFTAHLIVVELKGHNDNKYGHLVIFCSGIMENNNRHRKQFRGEQL